MQKRIKMKKELIKAHFIGTAVNAGKALQGAVKGYNDWKIPSSMNWLFAFGFKIGLLLAIKSFLIIRYQGMNLTAQGIIIVLSQLGLGAMLIVCGILMQDLELYSNPFSIRKISRLYLYTGLACSVVMGLRVTQSWEFFKNPESVNWFINFFSGIFKGAKEITLSILFADCDLWVAFCILLFLITYFYLDIKFEYQDSIHRRLIRKIPALKKGSLFIEEANNNDKSDDN